MSWSWLLGLDPAALGDARLELAVDPGWLLAAAVLVPVASAMFLGPSRDAPRDEPRDEPRDAPNDASRDAWIGSPAVSRTAGRLIGLVRGLLLFLVVFLLAEPELITRAEEPVPGAVAVLVDDSLSMRIPEQEATGRGEAAAAAFTPGTGAIAGALAARFDTRFYRFSRTLVPMGTGQAPSLSYPESDLGGALEALAGVEGRDGFAAVVVVTDGAVNAADVERAAAALRARGVRIYPVGVGSERHPRDVEVTRIEVPGQVVRGDAVDVGVSIRHSGLAGTRLRVLVEEERAILAESEVEADAATGVAHTVMRLEIQTPGPHRLTARVEPVDGEVHVANNARSAMIDVRAEPIRVLHYEGEPRFEVKFLRRAVHDDDGIELTSLIRTAENKHYRLGIARRDELAHGFPTAPEDLFRYQVLVIGSVHADLLARPQRELIREFVGRRGGGAIFLGGASAFAEGGFAGTVLAGIMPVVLAPRAARFLERVRARPSADGLGHPALGASPLARSRSAWEALPDLTVVNPLLETKPGATRLLEGERPGQRSLALLSLHRYGRGTVAAFAARDTWRWQINQRLGPDDRTHEALWQALLRYLSRPAAGRVSLRNPGGPIPVGAPVPIEVEVRDPAFRALSAADVRAEVTTPLGAIETIHLAWSGDRPGVFRGQVVAERPGQYDLRVRLYEEGAVADEAIAYADVTAEGAEPFDGDRDAGLLERVAQLTGGAHVTAARAGTLPDLIDDSRGVEFVEHRVQWWKAPIWLLIALVLICGEWLYRRKVRAP